MQQGSGGGNYKVCNFNLEQGLEGLLPQGLDAFGGGGGILGGAPQQGLSAEEQELSKRMKQLEADLRELQKKLKQEPELIEDPQVPPNTAAFLKGIVSDSKPSPQRPRLAIDTAVGGRVGLVYGVELLLISVISNGVSARFSRAACERRSWPQAASMSSPLRWRKRTRRPRLSRILRNCVLVVAWWACGMASLRQGCRE